VALLTFLGYTLGRDVGAIVGGLGISGLAIAFAAKETIENLIASVIIFLDKPFVVGDFVDVGGIKGSVELVGLRSTRLRTLDRSLVTIPNRKVVDSNLENLSQRPNQRHRIRIGVKHGTPSADILKIRELILTYLSTHPNVVDTSYVYFTELQDNGGYFMIQYYIGPIENDVTWGTQQEVNLFILDLFKSQGIEFAEFPR
jgi:MscS family membrane protein